MIYVNMKEDGKEERFMEILKENDISPSDKWSVSNEKDELPNRWFLLKDTDNFPLKNKRSKSNAAGLIVIILTILLSLEGIFELAGMNREFAGVIQLMLAITTPVLALIHLYQLKQKDQS